MADAPIKKGGGEGDAAKAGRGVLYIAFAKFYFMAAGLVLELRLPNVLGNITYGAYGVVNSVVSPFNNVLVTGTIQAVSRFASQRPDAVRSVQRAGLRMHLTFGLILAILVAAAAPLIALLFRDSGKIGPIQLAAVIVAAYSFYSVFVGTANGRREFHKQAGLDIGSATLRVLGILGLAGAGFGLYGAIGGWVGASIAILLISTVVVGLPGRAAPAEPVQEVRPMFRFLIGVSIYLLLLDIIMVADPLLLKALSAHWFDEHRAEALAALSPHAPAWLMAQLGTIDPAHAADGQVGYYRTVQTMARLPYQAIIAATFVIFPLVSRSTFENDRAATSRYIQTTVRYSFIFASAIAIVMVANPAPMLDLPYATDYASFGWPALIALSIGTVGFSIFAIAGTILNGAGLTRQAIWVAGITLAAAVASNAIVIPMFTPGRSLLLACSVATSCSMLLGAVASALVMRSRFGGFLPIATLIRVILAGAVAAGVGRVIPFTTPLGTILEAAVVGLVFLVALVALRELGGSDLAALGRVVRRRGGAG